MHENFLSIFNQKLGDKKQQLRKSEEKKRIIFISLLQSTTLFIYITLTKVSSAKLCLLAFCAS